MVLTKVGQKVWKVEYIENLSTLDTRDASAKRVIRYIMNYVLGKTGCGLLDEYKDLSIEEAFEDSGWKFTPFEREITGPTGIEKDEGFIAVHKNPLIIVYWCERETDSYREEPELKLYITGDAEEVILGIISEEALDLISELRMEIVGKLESVRDKIVTMRKGSMIGVNIGFVDSVRVTIKQ